jgi:hypothetical protein
VERGIVFICTYLKSQPSILDPMGSTRLPTVRGLRETGPDPPPMAWTRFTGPLWPGPRNKRRKPHGPPARGAEGKNKAPRGTQTSVTLRVRSQNPCPVLPFLINPSLRPLPLRPTPPPAPRPRTRYCSRRRFAALGFSRPVVRGASSSPGGGSAPLRFKGKGRPLFSLYYPSRSLRVG